MLLLGLSRGGSLYLLDTSPMSDVCFESISSHMVACLLFFPRTSFAKQKHLIFMKTNFPVFLLWLFLYVKRFFC